MTKAEKKTLRLEKKKLAHDEQCHLDGFFYPTRLLIAGFLSSLLMLVSLSVVFNLTTTLHATISSLASTATQTIYLSIGANAKMAKSNLGQELHDSDLTDLYEVGSTLHEKIDEFATAFYISFVFGFTISAAAFFLQLFWMVRSFKAQVMLARLGCRHVTDTTGTNRFPGRLTWEPKKKRMADVGNFLGVTVSNAVITFFLITFIFTPVVLLFAYAPLRGLLFWDYIWLKTPGILWIILAKVPEILGKDSVCKDVVINECCPYCIPSVFIHVHVSKHERPYCIPLSSSTPRRTPCFYLQHACLWVLEYRACRVAHDTWT